MDALNSLRTKVAKKVLQKTLSVKKGETVTVESWNNGLEFARVLLAEARAMGTTRFWFSRTKERISKESSGRRRTLLGRWGATSMEC